MAVLTVEERKDPFQKTTLPSLWISLCEILRSGLSDVWAPYVAMLLCCLTPYLCPCSAQTIMLGLK